MAQRFTLGSLLLVSVTACNAIIGGDSLAIREAIVFTPTGMKSESSHTVYLWQRPPHRVQLTVVVGNESGADVRLNDIVATVFDANVASRGTVTLVRNMELPAASRATFEGGMALPSATDMVLDLQANVRSASGHDRPVGGCTPLYRSTTSTVDRLCDTLMRRRDIASAHE